MAPTLLHLYGSVCDFIPHHGGFIHNLVDFCDPNNSNIFTGKPLCSVQDVTLCRMHKIHIFSRTSYVGSFLALCPPPFSAPAPEAVSVNLCDFKPAWLSTCLRSPSWPPPSVSEFMLQWPGATALLHSSPVQGAGLPSWPLHCHALSFVGWRATYLCAGM